MNLSLNELKSIREENSVTIICTTHRTKPDYLQDGLRLKNLIKDAENRLMADMDKKKAAALIKRIHSLADGIDHSHNQESLILFVNSEIAEYTRLPIKVADRVVIDDTFATRDLIRALHLETHYFILVLSREKARLLEVLNDKVIREAGKPFPMDFPRFSSASTAAMQVSSKQTNLYAEFFNRVDKQVNQHRKNNPLPVFIIALEENKNEYMKVADKKETIFNVSLNKNKINDPDHAIAEDAWKIVKEYVEKKNEQRKADLRKAVSENKFLSDPNEIWQAISQGRVETIFVEQGLFQPAELIDGEIVLVPESRRDEKGIIDDVYDEMIEMNMDYGGDVVFLPKGELDKFNGFGATTRY